MYAVGTSSNEIVEVKAANDKSKKKKAPVFHWQTKKPTNIPGIKK